MKNKITCSRCKQDKDKEDFYWKKESPTELKSKRCKKCVLELSKLKRQEKRRDAIYAF